MSDETTPAPQCYRHPGRETYVRCQRCDRPICPDCMIAASVGFQCPECVQEGSKSVRQARTSYGGLIPSGFSVSIILVGLNLIVWLAIQVTGGTTSDLAERFALWPIAVAQDDEWWRLGTSVFTQIAFLHLFFNVINIWILGPQLEAAFGRARFLAIYLLAGLAGSVAVYLFASPFTATIGASGAVFGLLGAMLVMVVRTGQPPQGILLWIGISVVYSFVVSGISWQAHIGGLVGGALISAAFVWAPRGRRRQLIQWGAVVVMAIVLVALTIVRTADLSGPVVLGS